jgi:hypothetical protein
VNYTPIGKRVFNVYIPHLSRMCGDYGLPGKRMITVSSAVGTTDYAKLTKVKNMSQVWNHSAAERKQ